MERLETKVRKALIDQKTDELVRYASENPEYKAITSELIETLIDSIADAMVSVFEDADEEEIAKMKQEGRKKVLPQVRAQFDNPEKLRQTMYEQAVNQYMSVRQLKEKLKPHFADIKEDREISGDVVADYEKAFEGLFKVVKTNDKIVRKLTKVAKTEGIDKAIQKDTRNSVIKEMFPTPDEYRAFAQRGMEAVRDFYQETQRALMADGKTGQALGGIIGAMEKVMKKAQEMTQKIQENYLEKTIQEIYG
jgi:hypothetical protein